MRYKLRRSGGSILLELERGGGWAISEADGNRAALIQRINALAPGLLPPTPRETTAQLRQVLLAIEQERERYARAGFIDQAE